MTVLLPLHSKQKKVIALSAVILVIAAFFIAGPKSSNCNVVVIPVRGYLSTYVSEQDVENYPNFTSSETILGKTMDAQNNPQIRGVLMIIDSEGGDPVAGEEVANALKRLNKTNVAVIRSISASASYWAATGAGRIFASKVSDVGGIGVTASYLDETKKNAKEGYTYIELTSAKYKDSGNPFKLLTEEEKSIFLSDIKKIHTIAVQDIAIKRNLPMEEVEKLADGRTFIGEDAFKYGLIDEIGDISAAKVYLKNQIKEEVRLCETQNEW